MVSTSLTVVRFRNGRLINVSRKNSFRINFS
uniref:Uncharacterized protein n=1 Tax=Anguilla anguilla TaxID=7936 RepID=A0A0E9XL42_ANGAN